MAGKFLLISKNRLLDLYQNKKLSTDSIAKIFHCNHVTVLNYLNKYNIPTRSRLGNRKPIRISKEMLENLYHNQKLTHKEIASKFGRSRYGIQRWMKIYKISSRSYSVANTHYKKYDFKKNLLDKAYMIGFRLGDLNIQQAKKLIRVRCSSTIQEQIDLIYDLFKAYGHPTMWRAKRGTLEIVILLNNSFDFLLPKLDEIEDWILEDKELFLSFIAGYSDAEGSFYLRKPYKYKKLPWGVFEIQTYDKNILSTISIYLNTLGIENKLRRSKIAGAIGKNGPWHKDAWQLIITKKQSLWNYIKLIEPYHRHKNKLQDLTIVKENLLLRNNAPYCKPIIF